MNSSPYFFQRQIPFTGLKSDQRTLVEHVHTSPHVNPAVRRRAHALILLDKGEPLDRIAADLHLTTRNLRSLIASHARHGVRVALLGSAAVPSARGSLVRAA